MDKLKKLWLSKDQTESILSIAKSESPRDYLILMLCRYGLRDGEILGRGNLPGIYVRDIRENGIWLVGKGYSHEGEAPTLYPLPSSFIILLQHFASSESRGKDRKLFDVGVRQFERLIKRYSKIAGIVDWQLAKPHRLRAFFATDLDDRGLSQFTIRDMMRHANIQTTNKYVGTKRVEKRAEIMETLT